MTKGIIFNIQKFSIHDGPGIRTTVFLKGCPLRCAWCSNPESQLAKVQIVYNEKKCCHCQACMGACLHHAISFHHHCPIVDFNLCQGCLTCIQTCPNEALSFEGEYKSVDDIVKVCLQDRDFYEESGGGITISGGEGMSQPIFLKALVLALKKERLHVAIETTGYIQPHIFHDLAPMFDLLLFDVKHYDSLKHQEGTQVSNELIITNLKWAIENHIPVLPRIPVIPGFNAQLNDAYGLTNLLKKVGATRVQLLPFHQFGERKYDLLNRDYALKNIPALYPEDLVEYQKVFIDAGLDCFF